MLALSHKMMAPYVEITLSEIVCVCSSLADISASSVGSSNQKTLLTSATGSVFFVNDGIDILGSLQLSHPVARFIVTSLQNVHSYCADGSKNYILYVTEILHSIQKHLETHGHLKHGEKPEKKFITKLSHALKDFENEFFPEKIFEKFSPLCCHIEKLDLDQILSHLEQVVKTILISSYSDSDSGFLAMLIINFLRCNAADVIYLLEAIEMSVDHFDVCVAKGIGKHFSSSQIIPGILIPLQQQIPKVDFILGKKLSFIILWNFLEIDIKENCKQTTFKISKNLDFPTLFSFKNTLCKRFLNDCNSCGIQIILCCQEIPQFAETIFEQHHILAVPYVSEETCEYFGNIFKKEPLNSITDKITDINICVASFCKKAFINDSVYLQIGIDQHDSVCISSTFLLSAPTPALYYNLSKQFKKCLKSLRMCFTSSFWSVSSKQLASESSYDKDCYQEIPGTKNIFRSPKRIVTIPVNVFQYGLWQLFEDVSFKQFCDSNSDAQILGEILTSAFREVFLKCSNESKRNILQYGQQKTFQITTDNSLKDSFPKKFWLPFQTEFHVLQSALHLVQQLLRIEGIIQMKGNKNFDII